MTDKPTPDQVIADLLNTMARTGFRSVFSMEMECSIDIAERHLEDNNWCRVDIGQASEHWIQR